MIRSILAAAAFLFPIAAAAAPAAEAHCAAPAARPEAPRIEEDEIPAAAPSGAPILDYCGIGAGSAIFADGTRADGAGFIAPTRDSRRAAAAIAASRHARIVAARGR